MEIRRSYDRLISTMGFPILVRRHLYIESGPWCLKKMAIVLQTIFLNMLYDNHCILIQISLKFVSNQKKKHHWFRWWLFTETLNNSFKQCAMWYANDRPPWVNQAQFLMLPLTNEDIFWMIFPFSLQRQDIIVSLLHYTSLSKYPFLASVINSCLVLQLGWAS